MYWLKIVSYILTNVFIEYDIRRNFECIYYFIMHYYTLYIVSLLCKEMFCLHGIIKQNANRDEYVSKIFFKAVDNKTFI